MYVAVLLDRLCILFRYALRESFGKSVDSKEILHRMGQMTDLTLLHISQLDTFQNHRDIDNPANQPKKVEGMVDEK